MAQEFDWDAEELEKHGERPPLKLFVEKGSRLTIKILTKCAACWVHNWTDGKSYRASGCSKEQSKGRCPVCEKAASLHGHDVKRRFGCVVLHIATEKKGSKEIVLKALPWVISVDKFNALKEIHDLTNKGLMKTELALTINSKIQSPKEAEKFQDLNIQQRPGSILEKLKTKKNYAQQIKEETSEEKIEQLKRFYAPTYEDIAKWMQSEEESTSFDPDEMEEDAEEIKDESEEKDESEDFEESTEEEEKEEPEEEEEEKPKKKGKGKKKSDEEEDEFADIFP